MKKRSTS